MFHVTCNFVFRPSQNILKAHSNKNTFASLISLCAKQLLRMVNTRSARLHLFEKKEQTRRVSRAQRGIWAETFYAASFTWQASLTAIWTFKYSITFQVSPPYYRTKAASVISNYIYKAPCDIAKYTHTHSPIKAKLIVIFSRSFQTNVHCKTNAHDPDRFESRPILAGSCFIQKRAWIRPVVTQINI